MHELLQGCSTRQQPRVQHKGLTVQPFGLRYTCGDGMQNPTLMLTHQWDWAVPERSLASASCIWQIYNFSCVTSMPFQSRSSCLLCYMRRQVHMQPTGCLQHSGNLCVWWFVWISGNELDWHKNTGKAASQMLLLWFGCIFWEYLTFVPLSGLQIIYLPGGLDSVS